jgi:hypothetical protein
MKKIQKTRFKFNRRPVVGTDMPGVFYHPGLRLG